MGKQKTKNTTPTSANLDNEFDVKKNLQKLKSGKSSTNYVTWQEINRTQRKQESISSANVQESPTTFDLVDINDNMHSRYDKLKDDFHTEIKEIKKEQQTISSSFSDKYLYKTDFWIIIGGLLALLATIGTLFYTLSYEKVIKDLDDVTKDVQKQKTEKVIVPPKKKASSQQEYLQ